MANKTDQKGPKLTNAELVKNSNNDQIEYDEDAQNKIVFGYIRNSQQLLPKNIPYFNIQ